MMIQFGEKTPIPWLIFFMAPAPLKKKQDFFPLGLCGIQLIFWLVVSIPLKNMKVSWDSYSQHMGK